MEIVQNKNSIPYVKEYDEDITTYMLKGGEFMPWEIDSWQECSMSWKESCYIHAGISGFAWQLIGPGAKELLSYASTNSIENWPLHFGKHLVFCDENGLIQAHALTVRDADESYRVFACNPWPIIRLLNTGDYQVEFNMVPMFVFQCSGPTSLTALEAATNTDLHGVRFLETVPVTIPGLEGDFEIQRIGMSGTLAYELRGPAELGPTVYDILYQAGKPYGMKRLGWRTYVVNHTEGGFPQVTCTFEQSCDLDPDFVASGMNIIPPIRTGSIDPDDVRARLRTPFEVDWGWMVKFDHDFVGREAVEAEAADPKRTVVNLEWNKEDILDIFASQWQEGEPYKLMEFPSAVQQPAGGHADHVTTPDGRKVGVSSDPLYSYYYRQTISQAIVDLEFAKEGTELIVQWGDFGKRIKNVRATVARYPYIDLESNQSYDTSKVPYGCER